MTRRFNLNAPKMETPCVEGDTVQFRHCGSIHSGQVRNLRRITCGIQTTGSGSHGMMQVPYIAIVTVHKGRCRENRQKS